jgi:G:T-mismatch repair DNA endonuclease (very short patch repair protein)/endogenous inhibitor of DNA gyrase (YacG/DUF329 family)
MVFNCDYCGKESTKRKSYFKEHNFCSRECYAAFRKIYYIGDKVYNYKPKSVYYCTNCGKEIESLECAMKNKKNIFCSKQCRNEYDSKVYSGKGNPNYQGGLTVNCLNCGKAFKRTPYQKGRAKYCSKECKDEYWSNVLSKTPENQERLKAHGVKVMKSQKTKFTKPEKIVNEYLINKNIISIPQHPMFNKYVVDFFIPSLNKVIEVLGDYWHGNPLKYPPDKITQRQLDAHLRDKSKKEYLEQEGYTVHMIWENDIYEQLEQTMSFLN